MRGASKNRFMLLLVFEKHGLENHGSFSYQNLLVLIPKKYLSSIDIIGGRAVARSENPGGGG